MWVVSAVGFFSVVEKPWDRDGKTLTVRARRREDLEGLRDRFLPTMGPISEDPGADYRFRAQAPREAVAVALAAMARGIDYQNFKAEVARVRGHDRAATYHEVWEVLRRLQPRD